MLLWLLVACRATVLHLTPTRPPDHVVDAYTASLGRRRYNHAFVGQTAIAVEEAAPSSTSSVARVRVPQDGLPLREIRQVSLLGSGGRAFRLGRRALLAWRMHEGSSDTAIRRGKDGSVATLAAIGPRWMPVWVMNPCRISYTEARRRGVAVSYATLEKHLIAGEERMSIYWATSGEVLFEVRSLSRGSGFLGRILFPFIFPSQRRFFEEQARCMREIVAAAQRT